MGAVVSCVEGLCRTVGSCIMAVIDGIGGILMAIINGIVTFLDILVSCLTCGYCGRGRSTTTGTRRGFRRRHYGTTTSTI